MRVLHHRLLDSLEKRERSTSFWHRAWTSYVCVSVVFDPAVSRTTDQSRLIASMVRAHVLVLAISLDSEEKGRVVDRQTKTRIRQQRGKMLRAFKVTDKRHCD